MSTKFRDLIGVGVMSDATALRALARWFDQRPQMLLLHPEGYEVPYFCPSGELKDNLNRIAELLERQDPLERMLEARREAEARLRADFQAKWGSFWKCMRCGASHGFPGSACSSCGAHGMIHRAGYSPAPGSGS